MASRPPRVQLVGLLPAILKPCGPACAQPFMDRTVRSLIREELDETPPFLLENAARAHDFAERLVREFGNRVRVEVVGLDSPKGVWLGLRHWIGRGFAVVVDGKEVFRDPPSFDGVETAVRRAVRAREGPEGHPS